MTKKDYILIANVIKKSDSKDDHNFINALCSELKRDNANFNKTTFINFIAK